MLGSPEQPDYELVLMLNTKPKEFIATLSLFIELMYGDAAMNIGAGRHGLPMGHLCDGSGVNFRSYVEKRLAVEVKRRRLTTTSSSRRPAKSVAIPTCGHIRYLGGFALSKGRPDAYAGRLTDISCYLFKGSGVKIHADVHVYLVIEPLSHIDRTSQRHVPGRLKSGARMSA
ncbi:hypothetical protein VP1G_10576 [Cytospora mali]|uniref:Uncharacterized protein n=1 Tax=Cytospora mali TaxID=578113 RepID=A0A194UQ66_CYTMA|nr:hypothetical protein VP1G_10576 [Valsa mali var. pyri (nom. inval.)]